MATKLEQVLNLEIIKILIIYHQIYQNNIIKRNKRDYKPLI